MIIDINVYSRYVHNITSDTISSSPLEHFDGPVLLLMLLLMMMITKITKPMNLSADLFLFVFFERARSDSVVF